MSEKTMDIALEIDCFNKVLKIEGTAIDGRARCLSGYAVAL